jgi:hypothetical protein
MAFAAELIQSGINVFGLNVDPALFAFLLAFILFGGLNLLEFKKFW